MFKMNAYEKLKSIQKENASILCVGLDTVYDKLPAILKKGSISSIMDFNRNIIEATKDLVCSYKINFAFYEQYGVEGIEILKKTFDLIPNNIVTIADAKRGDIGNTSLAYAKSCFEYFKADCITVSPYMGRDSIDPFLEYRDKLVFILALTSNPGSADFQRAEINGLPLYKHVLSQSLKWSGKENIGYVVGATNPDDLDELRKMAPEHFFLIPGIGTQGGSVKATMKANANGPAVINISRDIIYASQETDYIDKAREKAQFYKSSLI